MLAGALSLSGCEGGPSPTPGPTDPTTSTPAPVTTTAATEGAGELANATIALPFSPDTCTSEPLRYVDGKHTVSRPTPDGGNDVWNATIEATARADVDHDGTDEFIVEATCLWEGGPHGVFALRPDGNGGWATLGTAVAKSAGTGGIGAIGDVAVTSAGEVVVTVGSELDYSLQPYGLLNLPPVWQQRTYAWSGAAFAQTAGSTTFAADPAVASFTVQAPPVTLAQTSADVWDGTITVTVRADGPQAVAAALAVAMAAERPPGGDWARCGPDSDDDLGRL